MNFSHPLLPAPRRLQRQPADAKVAGHHALAGEHFEDAQDVFALAEAVEEDRHGADIDGVRAQPDQVAVEARQLRQHHPHPLRLRRNLQAEQFLYRQAPAQVIRQRRQVIHPVGERDRLLIELDFEFLFDAGVQVADVRLAMHDGFAIEFHQQPQHAVRGRMLRAHIEHQRASAGGGLFALQRGSDSWRVRFAHGQILAPVMG